MPAFNVKHALWFVVGVAAAMAVINQIPPVRDLMNKQWFA